MSLADFASLSGVTAPGALSVRETNFPVGVRFLPLSVRPQVAAFYAFARAADDIADSPLLPSDEKLARLAALGEALSGEAPDMAETASARHLRASLNGAGIPLDHAQHLLQAFKWDALGKPCRGWSDLLAYCRYSAAPVGRFLLDLFGESKANGPAADALCSALQILDHVQDCREDYVTLGRSYIPLEWMARERLDMSMLGDDKAGPGLRPVFDRVLDGVDRLLAAAQPLPAGVASFSLRVQAGVTLSLAFRLAARLRREDPMGRRVGLSRLDWFAAIMQGLWRGVRR